MKDCDGDVIGCLLCVDLDLDVLSVGKFYIKSGVVLGDGFDVVLMGV